MRHLCRAYDLATGTGRPGQFRPGEDMHALILAAGRAVRLGNLGVERPKGLLEIEGRSLLDYSLDNLVNRGVTNITIVTGHCDGMIHRHLGTRYRGVPIRYAFNPHYESTGSVLSLLIGAPHVIGSRFLVVESDILYHPGFIDAAMGTSESTLLVADQSGSGDEVFICATEDGYLDFLGKAAAPELRARSVGEYAGIALLSDQLLSSYCEEARKLNANGQAKGHYEELLYELACNGFRMGVRHCPSLPWTEVDTQEDLERAKTEIYPRLCHLWKSRAPLARSVGLSPAAIPKPLQQGYPHSHD